MVSQHKYVFVHSHMLMCEYSGGQLFQRELVVLNSTYMMIRPIGDIACYMAVRNFGGNSEQKMAVGASAKDPHLTLVIMDRP